MTNKEKYIEYTKNTFDGKAKELVLKQIDLFYKDNVIIPKHNYKIGDEIKLKKGTFPLCMVYQGYLIILIG